MIVFVAAPNQDQTTVTFTVDAALLRELGARLVGQPHIALAELIKNAYDADARHVRIEFANDTIILEDDGHGMSYDDFVQYWMRVGTTHKREGRLSPELGRSFTGSKGVGRLAAQLLANHLEITSVALVDKSTKGYVERFVASEGELTDRITAVVAWEQSVTAGDLTRVSVPVRRDRDNDQFANGAPFGTRLTMTGLASDWDESRFKALAREIWALEPPFEIDEDQREAFEIELVSSYGEVIEEFGTQMRAIFDNWRSKITYRLIEDDPVADVLFDLNPLAIEEGEEAGEELPSPSVPRSLAYAPAKILEIGIVSRESGTVPRKFLIRVADCLLDEMESEIRIFNLTHRQANNVTVEESRNYMAQFGGVHIYDGGFRLPYYGPQDWLNLERDHARRLSRSYLLPVELRSARQLHDLPSVRRVFGATRISTAHEAEVLPSIGVDPNDVLAIQVTRDRLVDNSAFRTLQRLIRVGLDLYADGSHRRPKAPPRKGSTPETRPSTKLADVRTAVVAARDVLDERTYQALTDNVDAAASAVANLEQRSDQVASLLGALATVGMTTLAWDHEASKQRHVVMDTSLQLRQLANDLAPEARSQLVEMADDLAAGANALQNIATLFKPVLDVSAREHVARVKAHPFIHATVRNLMALGRGAEVRAEGVPRDLVLPAASIAAWTAVIQNLVVNAFNAVLEQEVRRVDIDGGAEKGKQWLRIQDTGRGIDLSRAETYFEPFARGLSDDRRRTELGLGGSGLGLTIVRMITDPIGVTVRFVPPDGEYSTAVLLEWKDRT
jgi:signal transduction histidine kinase